MSYSRNPFLDLPNSSELSNASNLWKAPSETPMGGNILQGAKQGAYDLGDMGNKAWLNVAKKMGWDNNLPVKYDEYRRFSDDTARQFDQSEAGKSWAGTGARFGANAIPYALAPGGVEGGIATRILTGLLSNAGIGLLNDVADDQLTDLPNTTIGGIAGAAIPLAGYAVKTAGRPIYNWLFPKQSVLSTVAKSIDNTGEAIANKQAGESVGFHMTPAEASGNQFLAQIQGRLGISEDTAQQLQRFGQEHVDQQRNAISGLLDDISPTTGSASGDIRGAARGYLGKQYREVVDNASPIYKQVESEAVPDDVVQKLFQSKIIKGVHDSLDNNLSYADELTGFAPNSLKRFDYVKQSLDDMISKASPNEARLLKQARTKLVGELDNSFPMYPEARKAYGEGAKDLVANKNSQLGAIANLKDTQLKKVPNMIFDPAQTDINVMTKLRDQVLKQNPDSWRQGVRNYMDAKLNKTMNAENADTGVGNNFYSKFLEGDREFNQLLEATKGIPGAQQKLASMRSAFKNVINPTTSQTSARLAKSSLDVPRSTGQAVSNLISNMFGGRYDRAWVEYITNPSWDKELTQYMKSPVRNVYDKVQKFGTMLNKINTGLQGRESPPNVPDLPQQNTAPSQNSNNPFLSLPNAQ